MEYILNFVTPAVIAALVAAFMSISLPWVNWGIEKRRLLRQRRVECIDAVRRFAQDNGADLSELVQTPEYAALRKHFSKEFVERIEQVSPNFRLTIVLGPGRSSGVNNDLLPVLSSFRS